MFRIGYSKDIHNKVPGSKITLGGLLFNSKFSVDAYSDGDVLLHSICEAIMGSLAIGDLGKYFNKDKNNKGFSSQIIADFVKEKLAEHKYKINNIDCMIQVDDFIISKISDDLISNISKIFKIDKCLISIKATTSEGNYKNIIECSSIVSIKEI